MYLLHIYTTLVWVFKGAAWGLTRKYIMGKQFGNDFDAQPVRGVASQTVVGGQTAPTKHSTLFIIAQRLMTQ